MADSDKNIKITPNIGQSSEPKIEFTGADNNTVSQFVLDSGAISYEGSSGQLFSVTDDLSGDIYSVTDVSGIPSIQVKDTGSVINNAYNGNLLVGTVVDNDTDKLQAYGSLSVNGSSGQLLHITDDMDDVIFSANDISGIPIIKVTADGVVDMSNATLLLNPGEIIVPLEWKLPTNPSYVSGTLSADKSVFTAQSNVTRQYSGVIVNHVFTGDFEVVASWQHDYMGIGMVYGSAGTLTLDKFTGEATGDGGGNYWGSMGVTGLNPTSVGTFLGQYHAPISGNGGSTDNTKHYFKWSRSGNTLLIQYSTSSASGPWSNFSTNQTATINSSDVVIVGAGEASANENDPLRLLSITGY